MCLSIHIDTGSGKLNYAYDILGRESTVRLGQLTMVGNGGYSTNDIMSAKFYLGSSPLSTSLTPF